MIDNSSRYWRQQSNTQDFMKKDLKGVSKCIEMKI